jgi:hypothetical protein
MITPRFSITLALTAISVAGISAQDAITLTEAFAPGTQYTVNLKTDMTGELTLPSSGGSKAPQTVAMTGSSKLVYTERVLTAAEGGALRVVRQYRDVAFQRTTGSREQLATLRGSVSRLVVMRNEAGAKVPFSPDGPLTWGEIDAIRTDLFTPVLAAGLLPEKPVKPGDSWPISKSAQQDLTEMSPVESSTLKITFVSMVTVKDQPMARLSLSGTVTGATEDGPGVQTIDGTMYFNTKTRMLTYISIKGTQELQDGKKNRVGKIYGNFTLNREPVDAKTTITDDTLKDVALSPTPENTLLLYDNRELGVRFVHPRSWRIGAVQGKQITLEHTRKGGAILLTREELAQLPTPEAFLREARDQVAKLKGTVLAADGPKDNRFNLDAEINGKKLKLSYAIVRGETAGATLAARFPLAEEKEMSADLERILKGFEVSNKK